jgi:hypothetical protein
LKCLGVKQSEYIKILLSTWSRVKGGSTLFSQATAHLPLFAR